MKKLIRSKKAIGVDDLFPLLFIIIAFVVVILLFTFSHAKKESEINYAVTEATEDMASYNLLNNFLSSEIEVDLNAGYSDLPKELKNMTMADFIGLYYISLQSDSPNKDIYHAMIQQEVELAFNPSEHIYIISNGKEAYRTYAIFITEDPKEDYGNKAKTKAERKFRSQRYKEEGSWVYDKVVYKIPLPNYGVLYIELLKNYIQLDDFWKGKTE